MDELRQIMLEAQSDPEFGIVARSRVIREQSRLIRERACVERRCAAILRERAQAARRGRPAPRWFTETFWR